MSALLTLDVSAASARHLRASHLGSPFSREKPAYADQIRDWRRIVARRFVFCDSRRVSFYVADRLVQLEAGGDILLVQLASL